MYIIGASGHGKVVAEIAESTAIRVDGFVDSDPDKVELMGYPILKTVPEHSEIIIAVGNNRIRKQIAGSCVNSTFNTLSHRFATISTRANLDVGTVVMAGATVNVHVRIGMHCIINTNASVDHDCVLGDFVHISPNAALAGNVIVGEGTHIGIGACVIQGVKIGKWCTIGAGAVIIKDILDGCTVVGNPGRIINK